MNLIIENNYDAVSARAAQIVMDAINAAAPTPEKPFVLGCPTGGTPIGMYKELIRLNKEGKVSFRNVVTFNMEEDCVLSRRSRGRMPPVRGENKVLWRCGPLYGRCGTRRPYRL